MYSRKSRSYINLIIYTWNNLVIRKIPDWNKPKISKDEIETFENIRIKLKPAYNHENETFWNIRTKLKNTYD